MEAICVAVGQCEPAHGAIAGGTVSLVKMKTLH